jgi:hypothetical protein
MKHVTRVMLAALLATAACAPAANEGTGGGTAAPAPAPAAQQTAQRRDPDLISEAEIRARPELRNAYDLVQTLRPMWLRSRGSSTAGFGTTPVIQAYLDRQRLGAVSELSSIESAAIKEIRYYDAMAANSRFGTNNSAGAIQVISPGRGG